MQIKRLKLSGFKSFVDPAELRVERGLTGIVGPNGCGKSNLLEAIRWVMGEGSAKSLRGGAMDDVIFAGTTQRPSRDFAEVSILAESGAANDVGDFGRDVEVVRRIERGAGSAYRINGRDVRAKDVALVFADAATGAHSPALVSQGRIGSIISAKPAERRAMLEEAAGISGLHVRRKDAEQKLRATETNLNRLDEVLADMEVRAAALKRQARAAERYRKLSEEIRIAEGRLIYARWRDAAAAADKAREEAKVAEDLVATASEAQRAAAAWQAQAVIKLAELRSAALSARDAANEAGHSLATLAAERAALDRRIAELAAQTERLVSDREREGQLAHDAANALARLAAEVKTLDVQIAEAEAQRPDYAGRIATAEASVRDAEVELAQALTGQAREQAEARVAEAALAAAATRLDRTERDKARLDQELAVLDDDAPLIARRDAASASRSTAESEAKAASAAIEAAEARRSAAAARRETAESDGAAARASLAALEREAQALIKAVETRSGSNRALDRVRAETGFERALAAALGDDLEAEIGNVRERGWGGADALDSDPALPPGSSSLADHVQAPAELARRLSQIAVVVTDTGQALAVGQRLVTRDGRLRRWDGYASTGDGAAAAERLQRINRLAEIETAIAPARAEVESAQATLDAALADADTARGAAEIARADLSRAEQAQRNAQREEDQATTALERLASRKAEFAERLTRIRAEWTEAQADRATAETARAALPDGIATGQLVARLQSASENARGAVAQIKAESASLDRAITADRERLAAAQAETRGWKTRAGEAANRIAEMEKRAKAAEAEALALADMPAAIAGKIAALEIESAALSIVAEDAATAERAGEAELRAHETKTSELGEALAAAREARAGAVARAENQELRRVEMGRVSGERFECPPPLPARKSWLRERDGRRSGPGIGAARTSFGRPRAAWPGQPRRRERTGGDRRNARNLACRTRRTRRGDQPVARLDRQPQPRRADAVARGVRGGQRPFPAALHDLVQRWRGASCADRQRRSARSRT